MLWVYRLFVVVMLILIYLKVDKIIEILMIMSQILLTAQKKQ